MLYSGHPSYRQSDEIALELGMGLLVNRDPAAPAPVDAPPPDWPPWAAPDEEIAEGAAVAAALFAVPSLSAALMPARVSAASSSSR